MMNGRARGVACAAVLVIATLSLAGCSTGGSTPAPSATTSDPTGSLADLPSNWPDAIPVPAGLTLERTIPSPTGGTMAIYRGSGDLKTVAAQLRSGMKAAGYAEQSYFGPPVVRMSFTKDSELVALNINAALGKVTCAVTVHNR